MNRKRKLLEIVALVLGAIGLGESNFIVNFLSWGHQDQNWIDVQFWLWGRLFVWQVSLINAIIIFWSCLWFSWIFFLIASHWRKC